MASKFMKDHLSEFVLVVFVFVFFYHEPFLRIIFCCIPLDFVGLENASPRTRSPLNGMLNFLHSVSIPFAFP